MTGKRPNTKLLRKNARLARGRANVAPPVDGIAIGDGAEKLETGLTVLERVPEGGGGSGNSVRVKDGGPEYTVSPFRALLADRGRTIRSNQHVPTAKTRQGVMYAAGLGLSQGDIAKVMGISVDTLRNHYEEELSSAIHVMMNDIQTNLYNIARDPKHKGTVQAGMFLLSKLGGEVYRDKKSVELSGPDGKPLQIDQRTQTIDPMLLNPEQRDALRDILNSAMRLAQPSQAIEGPVVSGDYREVGDD